MLEPTTAPPVKQTSSVIEDCYNKESRERVPNGRTKITSVIDTLDALYVRLWRQVDRCIKKVIDFDLL